MEQFIMNSELRFADKVRQLGARLRDAEWRRYGMLLLTGKFAAIGLLLVGALLTHPDLIG